MKHGLNKAEGNPESNEIIPNCTVIQDGRVMSIPPHQMEGIQSECKCGGKFEPQWLDKIKTWSSVCCTCALVNLDKFINEDSAECSNLKVPVDHRVQGSGEKEKDSASRATQTTQEQPSEEFGQAIDPNQLADFAAQTAVEQIVLAYEQRAGRFSYEKEGDLNWRVNRMLDEIDLKDRALEITKRKIDIHFGHLPVTSPSQMEWENAVEKALMNQGVECSGDKHRVDYVPQTKEKLSAKPETLSPQTNVVN